MALNFYLKGFQAHCFKCLNKIYVLMIVSNQAEVLRLHSPSVAFSWMSDKIWDGLLGVQSVQTLNSAIHRIRIRETNCVIYWIAPSTLSNNCAQKCLQTMTRYCVKKLASLENTFTTNQNRVHNFSNMAMKKKRYTCKTILKHYPRINPFFRWRPWQSSQKELFYWVKQQMSGLNN